MAQNLSVAEINAAKEARNAYRRKWSRENRDKVYAQQMRYWAKKAKQTEKGGAD